ncbi:MAG: radical SAM protein [candidate division KSB1 bacterium]|nr:radical SAM protein [candidate division KSB1 bacterium]
MGRPPRILLVNPWVHDFAAYDLWARPLGLLYVGAVLRAAGCQVHLIDCLDRLHPDVVAKVGLLGAREDGTGKFFRQAIPKPSALRHVPRQFSRYGMPVEVFDRLLRACARPDAILVTTGMTYWYTGAMETVGRLREAFPGVPVVVGGIYATLCPDHARQTLAPDALVEGPAENQVVRVVNRVCGWSLPEPRYETLDEIPFPAYELYPRLEAVALLTSRGCPYRCTFCASSLLTGGPAQRAPGAVVEEIAYWVKRGVRHVAFYDDALLFRADEHIKPILELIVCRGLKVQFHTPNGVPPRAIDADLAVLLHRAGFSTLRLSFETISRERQHDMGSKVTAEDLARALHYLEHAGFQRQRVGVYLLMGLPGQDVREVVESILFVAGLGASVHLACFSPIAGTREYQRAVEWGLLPAEVDPLLCNESVYPLSDSRIGFWHYVRLRNFATSLNRRIRAGHRLAPLLHAGEVVDEIVHPRFSSVEEFLRRFERVRAKTRTEASAPRRAHLNSEEE